MNNQKKRLFIGVPLSEELVEQLITFADIFASYGKIVSRENLHLTLFFLGTVDEVQITDIILKTEQVFKNYDSISLEPRGITLFPPNSPRMVWLEFKKNQIFSNFVKDLYKELSTFSHTELEKKQIIPHVTLVRLKKSVPFNKIDSSLKIKNLIINSANLYESRLAHKGAMYTKLATFSLKKSF